MMELKKKGKEIKEFILENIDNASDNIVALTTQKFDITRQAVHKRIRNLINQGVLIRIKSGHYGLKSQTEWKINLSLSNNLSEDVVWRNDIVQRMGELSKNALGIWHYGFTEMFNNVIDHSGTEKVIITVKKNAYSTEMYISDHGIGIFYKIKNEMDLLDERQAVLELTKGKITTAPESHTGEGIFFTSRMFDKFSILSGEVFLTHQYGKGEDWILQNRENSPGTFICLKLRNNTPRTTKEIFDKFTSEDLKFTKTVVPVRMAQYGDEKLVSRSQAKRLLERIDRFKTVLLDFNEVESIGQAFADEVFRVFVNQHPNIEIIPINTNDIVMQMINRVYNFGDETKPSPSEPPNNLASDS